MQKNNDSIKIYPASVIQQQFWLAAQLDLETSAHHIPSVIKIKGNLDTATLKQSVVDLINHHEIFRTSFSVDSGNLVQVVAQVSEIEIPIVDIPENEIVNNHYFWENYILKEIRRPFDLKAGPLVRASILKTGFEEFYFVFIMHHCITDLQSKDMVGRELSARYNALAKGLIFSLDNAFSSYGDYAARHTAWLDSDECRRMLAYWKVNLTGKDGHIRLPLDFPRPSVQSFKGASVLFYVSKTQTHLLKKISRDNNVTLFLTLLAVYFIVLYRYSGQNTISIGIPFTNRRDERSKNVLGCFTSILPISVTLSDDTCFTELLSLIREVMLEAHRNQEVGFKTIVNALGLRRDPAYNPIFQVGFTFENPMALNLDGLETYSIPVHCGGSQLDLFPVLWETDEGIHGHIEYCTDLFEHQTIQRFTDHFMVLLDSVIMQNPQPVSQWQILGLDEKELIINHWNRTEKNYHIENGIHQYFEQQAHKTPHFVAVKYGDVSWTYHELNRRANLLAHWLMGRGVKAGVPVGILMERSLEMVVSIYGIVKAGGAYVPIDPDLPDERIEYMVHDTGISFIMTQQTFFRRIPSLYGKYVVLSTQWPDIEKMIDEDPVVQTRLDDPAYIIYTSGSTGRPKGVINTHRGIINRILWMQDAYNLTPSDVVLQKTPYSFDVSVWEFFWPLICGASLVVAAPEAHKDPAELIEIINNHHVTTLHFVPSMLNAFLDHPQACSCRSFKRVICSGEALPMSLQRKFFATIHAELHNLYGPTEAAVDVTSWTCQEKDNRPTVPIGKPIANTRIYILDKFMQPVPVGVAGELYIGGVQVAAGYLNLPDLTQKKFVRDPFTQEPGARVYKTGDLARFLSDGNIEYLGRNDEQIKIRGFRVELGDIETHICMHQGVSQCAVVKKEYSPEDVRLVAYVTPDMKRAYSVKKIQELSGKKQEDDCRLFDLPNGMTVWSMNDNSTQFMYNEIFEKKTYLQHGIVLHDGACVFDVGANIGLFSIFAATQVKEAQVFSFEPLPPIYNVLKHNIELFDLNIKSYPYGLSDKEEIARFTLYPHVSILSGRYADIAEDKATVRDHIFSMTSEPLNLSHEALEELLAEKLKSEVYDCRLKTLSDVIREENIQIIDLLKIDVEKAEHEVLAGIKEQEWCKIGQICIEVHESTGQKGIMIRMLEEKGFDVITVQSEEAGLHIVYAVHRTYPSIRKNLNCDFSIGKDKVWYSPKHLIDDVKVHLKERLPDYMIPNHFCMLTDMPLTGSGKIDRRSLPETDLKHPSFDGNYVAPINDLEKNMAKLWADILKIDRVSVEENFFDVGGTSLLSVYLLSQITALFGRTVSVVSFFRYPTIRALINYMFTETEKEDTGHANAKKRAELRKQSRARKSF
jgi:amino acid adenylation domain-containing protein/FkbM family methyltransferase